jgi:hypothetical protein
MNYKECREYSILTIHGILKVALNISGSLH